METATGVQILDEAVCISHRTNTFRKGVHPTILPPVMGRLGFLTLGMATDQGEGKLNSNLLNFA